MNVKELMIEGTKQWDNHKVMQLFSHDAARDILAVPLLDVVIVKEDCLVWREEQNGQYTASPLCEGNGEDDWHVLFECAESRECWAAAGLSSVIESRLQVLNNTQAMIHDICTKERKEVAGRVAVMIWILWNHRNNWLWNNEKMNASQLGGQAFQMWNDWFIAQNFQQDTRSGTTTCGWCIRDEAGMFVRAGTPWNHGTHSIIEAEALALLEAM
ncbi:pentatricopeptide repeat-containing protein, partial [Trifolium medium]|nr:pentatricopeptide repeat-containing protein [Trifolium medium]